jgi:tRNA(Ile)-lysidine synthase
MDPLGPFEPNPVIAVATSGGPDSLALAFLADAWARARDGRAIALIVDHGLRPESAAEAQRVVGWLRAAGIEHAVLAWRGPRSARGVQAAARAARHDLIEAWCRDHGVLHVAYGHHRGDQAETLLMRRRRDRHGDGLAAMAAVIERRHVRMLRPLLTVDRARLTATLAALGHPWIDDPSNRDSTFERVRVRARLPVLARRGWPAERLTALAALHGRDRALADTRLARWFGAAVTLHPGGFAILDGAALEAAAPDLRAAALANVIATVGARAYAPPRESCARLARDLGRPRTLGGCLVRPHRGALIVAREPRAIGPAVRLNGHDALWDGRFVVSGPARAGEGFVVRQLGRDGLRRVVESVGSWPWPRAFLVGLPSIWRLDELVAVSHLHIDRMRNPGSLCFTMTWRPPRPLVAPFVAGAEPWGGRGQGGVAC